MCGLCGVLGASAHWSEGVALPGAGTAPWMRRQARLRSVALANAVTAQHGVEVRDWQGTMLVVTGPTGRSELAQGLDDLWPKIEAVLGGTVDPLDPVLLAALDG